MNHSLVGEFKELLGEHKVYTDEPMKNHTTFKIGGPARIFVTPKNRGELCRCIQLSQRAGAEYFIVGNGSNLLVRDGGIDAVVICTVEMTDICVSGTMMEADCGALLSKVASAAAKESLSGLEFASGIPGTLGGGIFMNAGAYGGELKDIVCSVSAWMDGEICELSVEDCGFGYRSSVFSKNGGIILGAKLKLQPGVKEEILEKSRELNRRRVEKQPLDYPSAGSTFKRPPGYFAGALIQQAGLKGYEIGGAQVSEKHSGFIINAGGATAKNVLDLIEYVKAEVKRCSGVELTEEIKVVGKD